MRLIVCDLETDSPNPANAEILEIYLGEYRNGLIVNELELRVRPRRWNPESEKAVKIHGITMSEAMNGLDWKRSMKKIYDFLPEDPCYFLCHANRRAGTRGCFDYQVLTTHFNQLNSDIYFFFLKVLPPDKVISTHSLVKSFLQLEANDLKTACNHFGIEISKHHAAKSDAIACLEIFKKFESKVDMKKFAEHDFYDVPYDIPYKH